MKRERKVNNKKSRNGMVEIVLDLLTSVLIFWK